MDVFRSFCVQLVNPGVILQGLGFRVGTTFVVNHSIISPHGIAGSVWDLQLIQPDPGGLEMYEERIEWARQRKGWTGELFYQLARSGGVGLDDVGRDMDRWFDALQTLVERASGRLRHQL